MRYASDFQNLQMWWNIGVNTSDHALSHPKVQKLIQMKTSPFDCLIMEQFFHESFLMFGHKFKIPVITAGTMGYADYMDHAMGLLTPLSHIPHLLLPYKDEMTFKQRAYNFYLSIYDNFFRRFHYFPRMQSQAEKHFGRFIEGPLPSVRDLEKKISLMMINSHRSIDIPRPTIAGLVNVGGIHIKPARPLPSDIQTFIDGAKHGVVYFSLGSYMKSTDMPKDKIKMLMDGFARLKQRVIWKYEDENIKNLPKNVMVKKWMPQNDILAQENVILFMTHGGLFGSQEGIYWAKPMLCIPLYGDQHRNTIKAVQEGYALSLVLSEMTSDLLVQKVNEMISNKKYTQKAKALSNRFRDNPISPKDEAMYWIEYIIRHKGAKHLKSKAVDMSLWEYLALDIVFLYGGLALLALFVCLRVIYRLVLWVWVKNNENSDFDKKVQ